MSNVFGLLDDYVRMLADIKNPAFLYRFIRDKGQHFPRHVSAHTMYGRGQIKQCFMNSAKLAENHPGLRYVEGYAVTTRLPWFLAHHAWCVDEEDRVVDVTWDSGMDYWGVVFDPATIREEHNRHGNFCLLDSGTGYNMSLIMRLYPELEQISEQVAGRAINWR